MRLTPPSALAVFATTAMLAACGKVDNDDRPLVTFPHVPALSPVAANATFGTWTSGHAIVAHGADVIAVDRLNNSIVRLDAATLEVRATIAVDGEPERLIAGLAGTVYATLDSGDVIEIPAGASQVARTVSVGVDADGLAMSQDGTLIFAVSPSAKTLSVLDPASMTVTRTHSLKRTPGAVAAARNHVVVTFPFDDVTLRVAMDDVAFGQPQLDTDLVPTSTLRTGAPADRALMTARIPRVTPSRSTGAVVGWNGDRVYVSHVQVMTGDADDLASLAAGLEFEDKASPPPAPQYYGSEPAGTSSFDFDISFPPPTRPVEPIVTVVGSTPDDMVARPHVRDAISGEPLNHRLSDPVDIVLNPALQLLVMVGEGSDSLLVYSGDMEDPMASPLAEIATGPRPLGIAFSADGKTGYVLHGHDLSVGVVDMTPFFELQPSTTESVGGDPFLGRDMVAPPTGMAVSKSSTFAADPRTAEQARGERLFTFARNPELSRDGHFSCATCHPGGAEDKLTWVINDGPRQTPSLQGRLAGTAPFNWNGTRDHLQNNMERTVGRMGGDGLSAWDLANLETFLNEGLNDVPRNPNLAADGTLNELQELGRQVFNDSEVGCASCHVGGDGVDGMNHDVGTGSDLEREIWRVWSKRGNTDINDPDRFNTPSLKGLWRSAPYLHDGSADTLEDVLDIAWRMGNSQALTDGERDALVAYLLTL